MSFSFKTRSHVQIIPFSIYIYHLDNFNSIVNFKCLTCVSNYFIVKLLMSCVEDKFAWLRDDEFGRQAIAGVNPVTIEKLQVFPPVSKLDPEIYGPLESALREEHILHQLNGMTVQQVPINSFMILLTILCN